MVNVSIVILTKNEEKNILDCLRCFTDVAEIIVVDDFSDDRTVEIIESFKEKNIKVYKNKLNYDFSAQRNFGLSKATSEWVLFIDVDERISSGLFLEIENAITNNHYDGFYIKRKDVMWGKILKYGETGNIKLLRLAKKNSGKWKGAVHEVWDINGKVGNLSGNIMHYPHQTVKEFISEINMYTAIRAAELHKNGVKVGFFEIILYPKVKFLQNYFLKLGFLDGIQGFNYAALMSFHSFLVRGKTYLLWQKKSS